MILNLVKRIKSHFNPNMVRIELAYDRETIPVSGALRVWAKLDRYGKLPLHVGECKVVNHLYIGEGEEFADRFHSNCRSVFTRVRAPREERVFWLSDLSQEDQEFVKSAPRIVVNGLDWGEADLMYGPLDYPIDNEVFLNQRAVLRGEIDSIKLFSMECRTAGQIACIFYNEKTQRLSYYIMNYEDYTPNVLIVRRGLEKYLVVYEIHRHASDNYVLQYTDANGVDIQQKTYIDYVN